MKQRLTAPMVSSRQLAYLEAMEIGVWTLRESSPVTGSDTGPAPGVKLGPGGGGVLLVCETDADSASRLANDISRALESVPVWAWPLATEVAVGLEKAIDENLFTTVAFFGADLAESFLGPDPPASLNSAKLVLLPAMQDLLSKPEARRTLWNLFCRSGMVSTCDFGA